MIVHCSRDVLLDHIGVVSKAVSSRTTLPILECVLLSAEDDTFRLTANDLEMAIETCAIHAEIAEPGAVALEAKMFFEIVRRLPAGMVDISSDKNNVTVIRCEKSEFKILGLAADEFPAMPAVSKSDCRLVKAAELKSMIRKTIFAVSFDETKPVLTGELLEIKDGALNVVAVDGFRVSYCKTALEGDTGDMSIVVPSKTLNELSKILPGGEGDEISLYFTEKHVLMEADGYTVTSRILDGDFIKYEQLFSGEYTTILTADRLTLLSSLERASLIASKEIRKNPIKIKIEGDTLTVSSNTEAGAVTDEITVDVDGNDLEIAFNPRYLTDVLKAIDESAVTVALTTPLSPCVIRAVDNENVKYLVLPLRLNG